MNIIFHEKVLQIDLPIDATADTYIACIEITDVKNLAEILIVDITNTSWMSELGPVGLATFRNTVLRTIDKLVEVFKSVDNEIFTGNSKTKEDFGEFMISMSSGYCLQDKHNHDILPLSELWKPKLTGNEGFDFHTVSPENKFSFGESKFLSSGNAYGKAAEQICEFIELGKDAGDSGLLFHFNKPDAINNLLSGKRGFVVAFSINSENHELVLMNSLKNENIKKLTKGCDELYIIGIKIGNQIV